jgi:hypothetical protein
VPGLLGFHPEESVVLVTVGDARQPFHARVDLPVDPVDVEALAAHLAGVAARNGVTRIACVIYSDDAGLAEAFGSEIDGRLRAVAVQLVCAVRADGRRWWPLGGEPDAPGAPYDVSSHPLMAQTVMEGTVVLGSRRELADTLEGDDPKETLRVGRLADEVLGRLALTLDGRSDRRTIRRHLGVEGRWVRHRVCRFLEDGRRLDDSDAARLATLVALSVEVRDVAWAEMSQATASRHVDLWRDVVRRVPVHLRAAPAAMLGFAAWLSGDGALAWCAVERALEAEPGYRLAELLSDALAGAVPPSAWQPIPRDELTLFGGEAGH